MTMETERRCYRAGELRLVQDGKTRRIVGHAAVFNSPSEDLGGFIEQVAQGAFTDALITSDCRALVNHNPDRVLGRTKSGTLRLWEDSKGLAVDINPPDAQWARDMLVSIERGDISGMSFGFRVGRDRWESIDGISRRTILKIDELFDVSLVTYPAYPETDAALRSLARWSGRAGNSLVEVYSKKVELLKREMEGTPEGRDALLSAKADRLRKEKREIDARQ